MAKNNVYEVTFRLYPYGKEQTMMVVSDDVKSLRFRCKERERKGWIKSFSITRVKTKKI
jgi:hypothetical protein